MGQPIGSRYELEGQLGRGAFGSVWRGRVRDSGEAVAVKVLLEELAVDADVVTRFLRERTALVGLRHRSLVSVRDLVVEGDVLALVMQLVEGPDLRAYLRGRGTLGQEEAALLVADVADALSVAHAAKIIHRDVKPANVLLQPEDGGFRPLLTDFGIARLADAPSVTRTHQVVGTPYYLSPEVIAGQKATAAVDVYASGIMLYELLTGHPPFRGRDAMEVFRAHQSASPARPAGISDRLWDVALAALSKDPDERPAAEDLAGRLRGAVRINQDGTTVRLPVNSSEGTVVLPALPPELKLVAGGAAPPTPAWPRSGQQAAAGHLAAALNPTVPIKPTSSPARPTQAPALPPAAVRAPIAPQHYPPLQRQNPPTQAYVAPRPANQPPANQQRGNPYAASPYQQPVMPVAQYRPAQQNAYPPPRNKAPRHPQPYNANVPPSSGLSCLSKLAILVIVLAIAIAIGVAVGKQIAKSHGTSGSSGLGRGNGPTPPIARMIFDH